MMVTWIMRAYAVVALVISLGGFAWMFVSPPESLKTDRDGVGHFAPQVMHPITEEAIDMNELIRHYKGD